MFRPFFKVAAQSPGRQSTFRSLLCVHLIFLAVLLGVVRQGGPPVLPVLGLCLLVAGIVEGALLIGWRLTQLPKTRALEFLLASPLRPPLILIAELLVGACRLGMLTLAGLPPLLLLLADNILEPADVLVLLLVPWTWGMVTGLGLTVWAYEPSWLRRVGERVILGGILFYLVVGVLAAEKIVDWLGELPWGMTNGLLHGVYAFHFYNPFAMMKHYFLAPVAQSLSLLLWMEGLALAAVLLLAVRAARRLQPHYQERHYSPVADVSGQLRAGIGEEPLSWWAVKRVTEYSGRVNLWLASGFGILYALHIVAGALWPEWLGRQVFLVVDNVFGVAGMATGLMVLAAVPAAFQYGLWDSNAQDRCRRLELLLLTELEARDYWNAALTAAWRRGSGYCWVACLLWAAALLSGRLSVPQVLVAAAGSWVLWRLYFVLGFYAFTRGTQSSQLGLLLTAGLPLVCYGLVKMDLAPLALVLPPGFLTLPGSTSLVSWLPPCAIALYALVAYKLEGHALARCDGALRRWYTEYHGASVVE